MRKLFLAIIIFFMTASVSFAQVAANTAIVNLDAKATPVGADGLIVNDSADSNRSKLSTITQLLIDANIPDTITIDLATTVTTNANLTGDVTSVGNAATIADSVTVTGWVLGTSSATQLTSPTLITDLIDTTGAADIDIGSGDVTDVTITTDGGALIIDGATLTGPAAGLTVSTSTNGALTLDSAGSGLTTLKAGSGGVTVSTDAGNSDITLTPHGTGDVIISSLTASEIVITDASKGLQSAAVATYPSLTELTYVKGVTSAIQTQLGAKASTTHASTHSADQSDEVFGENLGTACTINQIWKSDGDGTVSCAADADSGGAPEGTAVLSTGEVGGTKFLREDGDGTSSWQAASGGGGDFSWTLEPQQAKLPSSNPMAIDAGNNKWRGLFDDTTDECARWEGVLQPFSATMKAKVYYTAVSATSGTAAFTIEIECTTDADARDFDTDSFGTADSLTGTVAGTAGYLDVLSDASLNEDSCAEHDTIVVKVCRDADGSDTVTGDLELRKVQIYAE